MANHAYGTGGTEGRDGGVYHFMHMQEVPEVDDKLKDGITTEWVRHPDPDPDADAEVGT